ncbi:MAG: TIGR04086 family membrane protein [bacterium]
MCSSIWNPHGLSFSFGITSLVIGSLAFYVEALAVWNNSIAIIAGLFSACLGGMAAAAKAKSLGWLHGGLVGIGFVLVSYLVSLFWGHEAALLSLLFYRCVWGLIIGAYGRYDGSNFFIDEVERGCLT